jgi:hypothetical protein
MTREDSRCTGVILLEPKPRIDRCCDPSGVDYDTRTLSGGVASLNPRLIYGTPAGVLRSSLHSVAIVLTIPKRSRGNAIHVLARASG